MTAEQPHLPAPPPRPPAPSPKIPAAPSGGWPQQPPPTGWPQQPVLGPPVPHQVPAPPATGGFAAPYAPSHGSFVEPPKRASATVGIIALALALLAAVGASVTGGLAAFQIGLGIDPSTFSLNSATFDILAVLSPVRDWVLVGEVSFWVGTALGVWALAQGIAALVTGRGRGAAVAAVILAVIGPAIFFFTAVIAISASL